MPQTNQTSNTIIIGIDLGTTNSLVAYSDAKGPRILAPENDTSGGGAGGLLPSVVRLAEDGRTVEALGQSARDQATSHPTRTIASVKRLMGRSIDDVKADLPLLSYEVAPSPQNAARVKINGHLITPPEISAHILRALRDRASQALSTDVTRAVITVPAYFDDAQRQATRDAARLAGLEAVRIVNEPTAAALAYGIGARAGKQQTIAVYDLGGGTFDISILRVTPSTDDDAQEPAFFEVLSTAGDTRLGGDDVDQALLLLLLSHLPDPARKQILLSPSARQSLRHAAERAKIELSNRDAAHVSLRLDQHHEIERAVTRAELEALLAPLITRTLDRCKQACRDANIKPADVDRVVMVGGSTRIPAVRAAVAKLFDTEPYTAINPDLVVALGASVQAAILAGHRADALLLDVIPLSLGLETIGGGVAKLLIRNQSVPARAVETFSTSVDGQTSIKLAVFQGEREMAADCRLLATLHLSGIPPMPAGIPVLEVEFLVDANGVLNVSAHEKRSGKRAALQVVPAHGLTRDEVDRIERESLTHARDDMTRHRLADLATSARLDAKWCEDALARTESSLDPAYVRELRARIAELRALGESTTRDWKSVDPNAFQRAKEALDHASIPLHEAAIAESLRGADAD